MPAALNIYEGPNAVREFLDPGRQPHLPLVEIPDTLNPFAQDRVRVFAKLMGISPLANVKALPAYKMMREHHRRGEPSVSPRAIPGIGPVGGMTGTKASIRCSPGSRSP